MTGLFHARLRTVLLAGAICAPAVAHADSAPAPAPAAAGDEIVVSARYRKESAQAVPIAITALGGKALDAREIYNLQDLSRTVPTVDFRDSSSNKDRTVFIRGIGTISTSPGVEPSVSTVVDGVVLARPGEATIDVGEIERVEVLRGPQGTLFGKNASAGVVNVVTAGPSEQFHAYGEAGITTDQEYRIKAGVTGSIAPNLTARIDGLYTKWDGNVTNAGTGNTVNGYERFGGRGKLQWTPAPNVKITLAADYLQSHDTVPSGVFTSASQTANRTGVVTTNTAIASYFNSIGVSLDPDNRTATSNFDSDVHDKNYGTSLTGEWQLDGGYTVTSITAWRGWKNHQHQDYDQLAALTSSLYQGEDRGDLTANQVSQELRLTSPKGHLVDYVVGAYFLHATDDERYRRDITEVLSGKDTPFEGIANYGTTQNNYALFGEANINITSRFRAIAGYRSSWEDLSYYQNRVSSNDPNNTGNTALAVPAINAYHASAGSTSTRGDTARAGLQYDFAPSNQVYFTWSRGYKGPAFDAYFNMRPVDEITLKPETSNSFEIGAKGDVLDRKVTYALALFTTTFDNYQANYNDVVAGAQVTRLINAGRVGTKGVEADVGLHPIAGLSLDSALAYDDAKVLQFNCPTGAAATCNVNGEPLPFAPKWKLDENLAYRFALNADLDLQVQTDVSYKSATQYQLTETPSTIQPAYAIWNGSVTLFGTKQGWQFRAYVKNLLNQHYSDYLAGGNIGGTVRFVPRDDVRYAGFVIRKEF